MTDAIPFHRPDITAEDRERVDAVLRSGWLTSGPVVREFEQRFAETVGARHAVALNSCTAALHLALAAYEIGPGDEVLVPTLTFAATAEVVLALGATPVLVDCRPGDLTIDVDHARTLVTTRTRAIMPVHYAGHPCDVDAVQRLADDHDLRVIEDAAHAFPASSGGRPIGSTGDVVCFSFYANKTLTTGEGGMATTDDEGIADAMRQLSLHGLSRGAWGRFKKGGSWNYDIVRAGYKYNLPDTSAALGLSQLDRAPEAREEREKIAGWYSAALSDVDGVSLLETTPGNLHAWHLLVVLVDADAFGATRDDVIEQLAGADIGTSVHYRPLHQHSLYCETTDPSSFPVAEAVFPQLLTLPLFPGMTKVQVERVVAHIRATST